MLELDKCLIICYCIYLNIFTKIFEQTVDPDQTTPLGSALLGTYLISKS